MEFFLKYLKDIASSPLALVGYTIVVIAWIVRYYLLYKPQTKAKEILEKFSEDDKRLLALKSLIGVDPPSDLKEPDSILEWTRLKTKEKSKIYLLIAFLATLLTAVLITGLAIYKSLISTPPHDNIVACTDEQSKSCPIEISSFVYKESHPVDSEYSGITWKEYYSDVRVFITNKTSNTINDTSIVIDPETHIRKIRQITQIPDVTFASGKGAVRSIALIGVDENGNKISIPIDVDGPGEKIMPYYRMLCPKLLPFSEIQIVIACIAPNQSADGKPPKKFIWERRDPEWIRFEGSYKVHKDSKMTIYNVKSEISLN